VVRTRGQYPTPPPKDDTILHYHDNSVEQLYNMRTTPQGVSVKVRSFTRFLV